MISSGGKKQIDEKPSGTEGRRGENKQKQKQTEYGKSAKQVTVVVWYVRGLFFLGGEEGWQEKMTNEKSAPFVGFCARWKEKMIAETHPNE